jgi:hypothetical protein
MDWCAAWRIHVRVTEHSWAADEPTVAGPELVLEPDVPDEHRAARPFKDALVRDGIPFARAFTARRGAERRPGSIHSPRDPFHELQGAFSRGVL